MNREAITRTDAQAASNSEAVKAKTSGVHHELHDIVDQMRGLSASGRKELYGKNQDSGCVAVPTFAIDQGDAECLATTVPSSEPVPKPVQIRAEPASGRTTLANGDWEQNRIDASTGATVRTLHVEKTSETSITRDDRAGNHSFSVFDQHGVPVLTTKTSENFEETSRFDSTGQVKTSWSDTPNHHHWQNRNYDGTVTTKEINKTSGETNTTIRDKNGVEVKGLSQVQAIDALKEELRLASSVDKFSGAVSVSKGGEPIFEQVEGKADRSANKDIDTNTKFRIASMGKMFTAVAIHQLAEQGKIKLSDTLDKYLPDYPNKEFTSHVTIAELLSHRGGTGDIFSPEYDSKREELKSKGEDIKTISDYLHFYESNVSGGAFGKGHFNEGDKAPERDPETGKYPFHYSNYGFMLLGAVVSHVAGKTEADRDSGKGYEDYLNEHVFAPAGMTSTGLKPEETVSGLSVGYTKVKSDLVPNTDVLPYSGSPAGGGYSTIGDMAKFGSALMQNKLLTKETFDSILSNVDQSNEEALGLHVSKRWGELSIGHSGGFDGMSGNLIIMPKSGYVIAALSNLDPPAADDVSGYIADRLPKNQ